MALRLIEIISEISLSQRKTITVESGLVQGGSNYVYELRSGNDERWSLRIPVDEGAGRLAVRGASILKEAKKKEPALRVPAVIQSSEQFMIMEFLPGHALGSWNTHSLTKERRQILLDDLAHFLFTLWKIKLHAPQAMGDRKPYRRWLQDEVDRGLRRTLQGSSSWGEPIHYLRRRIRINDLVPDPDDGLVAIKHGDLNAWNIIVDETGLSGVVDWDTCCIAPIASAIQYPLFIADVPGWHNDDVPEGMTFEEDRAYLEKAIRMLEGDCPTPGPIATLLRTSSERQFFELSLHNAQINDAYVKTRLNTHLEKDVVRKELEAFLSTNESLQTHPAVLDLQAQLTG